MAVSPLVRPPGSENGGSIKKLQPANATAEGSNGGTHDIAEHMNELEKRKYVKGRF